MYIVVWFDTNLWYLKIGQY